MTIDNPKENVPSDWDRLAERSAEPSATPPAEAGMALPPPPVLTTVAASWGDALAVLAVCTAELGAVHALGYGFGMSVLPWAALAALSWWLLTCSALIVVRHGTAGMLMAGIVFSEPVPPRRIPWVLAVASASALTVGLPGLVGALRHPLAVTAGAPLVHVGVAEDRDPSTIRRGA